MNMTTRLFSLLTLSCSLVGCMADAAVPSNPALPSGEPFEGSEHAVERGKADGEGGGDFTVDSRLVEGDPQRCQFSVIPGGPSFSLVFGDVAQASALGAGAADVLSCRIALDVVMPAGTGQFVDHVGSIVMVGASVSPGASALARVAVELDGRTLQTVNATWDEDNPIGSGEEYVADASLSASRPKEAQCQADAEPFRASMVVDLRLEVEGNDGVAHVDSLDVRFGTDLCEGDPLSAAKACMAEKCAEARDACNDAGPGAANTCLSSYWSVLNDCEGDFANEACRDEQVVEAVARCKSMTCGEDASCAQRCEDVSVFATLAACLIDNGCAPLFAGR